MMSFAESTQKENGTKKVAQLQFLKSVLLVEDESHWESKWIRILKRSGKYTITTSKSIESARKKLSSDKFHFHVVIVDLNLDAYNPDNNDGFLLLQYIKQQDQKPGTVALDHQTDPKMTSEQMKRLFKIGVINYFEKNPSDGHFNQQDFLQAVSEEAERSETVDVFMAMPFKEEYRAYYSSAIKRTLSGLGLNCKRSDEIRNSSQVMKDIRWYIQHSQFLVADLSEANVNTIFELGAADALHKDAIVITRNLGDIPAFIRDVRQCHHYLSGILGADKLKELLIEEISKLQGGDPRSIFPKDVTSIEAQYCFALVPTYTSHMDDAYTHIIKHALEEAPLTLRCEHVNEVVASWSITEKIWSCINKACVIVADLAGEDRKVFYWAGVSFGRDSTFISMSHFGQEIPFDLRGGTNIEYSLLDDRGLNVREDLKLKVGKLLEERRSKIPQAAGAKEQKKGRRPRKKKPVSASDKNKDSLNRKPSSVDVVILTALQEEYDAALGQIPNAHSFPMESGQTNLYAWQTGYIPCYLYKKPYQIMLGKIGAAGTPVSALAALDAINLWKPRYIIFSGIAGGLIGLEKASKDATYEPDIHLGDVIIAKIVHGYEYGKFEEKFIPRDHWTYPVDEGLYNGAEVYGKRRTWIQNLLVKPPQDCSPDVFVGEIASGDKVVENPKNEFFKQVLKQWPKCKAVEMEGAGVGAAIFQAQSQGKAVGFLVIRGISDIPRPKAGDDLGEWGKERGSQERELWKRFAAETAAAVTVGYIGNGLPVRPKGLSE